MDPSSTVSISVSPEMADAIADKFTLSHDASGQPVRHAAFTAGRGVLASLHDTSIALATAELDIKRAGLTDPATVDRLRRAAVNKMNGVRKSASDGLAALQSHVDQINKQIDADLGVPTATIDANANARAGEIRQYIRSLPQRERAEVIRRAITEGDKAVAAAVLSGGSPLASGLTSKELDFARSDAEEKFCKPAVAMREAVAKMIGLCETAIKVTESRFGPLTGAGDSPAAAAARSLARLEGGQ